MNFFNNIREIGRAKYWRYACTTFLDALAVGFGSGIYMELNIRYNFEFRDNLLLFIGIVFILLCCSIFLHKLILRNNITYQIFKLFGDFIVGISVYIFILAFTSKQIDCKILGNIILAFSLFSLAALLSYAYSKRLQESKEKPN